MRFVLICLSHLFLPVFIIKVEVYCILDRQYFQNTAVIYGLIILSSVFVSQWDVSPNDHVRHSFVFKKR